MKRFVAINEYILRKSEGLSDVLEDEDIPAHLIVLFPLIHDLKAHSLSESPTRHFLPHIPMGALYTSEIIAGDAKFSG